MDSVPPDKRMPYTHGVGVTRSHDQSCAGGGNGTSSETENQGTSGGAAVSSLIHLPPHHSPDQCDVSHSYNPMCGHIIEDHNVH